MRIPSSGDRLTRAVLILALGATVLGVAARLDTLDRKTFWVDESFAMLRVSGHGEKELAVLFDGRVHRAAEVLALQTVTPARGVAATVASLREEPQRGPLFYVLARLWIGVAGNGVAAMRAFPALVGIAGIGAAFLAGRRIAGGTLGGALLAATVALSPIAIHFSRQVREFVLVGDLALLSVWLAARAIERSDGRRWLAYACCALAGVLTNPTFAAVVAAQGVVVLALAAARRERRLARDYAAAVAGAALAYAPWALGIPRAAARASDEIAWAGTPASPGAAALKWAFNIGASFFDSEYAHRAWGVVLVPLLLIVAWAIVRTVVARDARATTAGTGLAFALLLATSVPLVAIDLVEHAHYALVTRYQVPTWLGVQMLAVVWLAAALRSRAANVRAFAAGTFAFIVACGAVSIAAGRPYVQWWDNNDHLSEDTVAAVVERGPQPSLLIAAGDTPAAYNAFVLSRYLPARTALLLYDGALPAFPRGYAATYLFAPSSAALAAAARTGDAPRNVSPAVAFAVPELTASGDVANVVRADNALWSIAVRPQ